jgi:uncharacterized protein YifN (PemK superfamily)
MTKRRPVVVVSTRLPYRDGLCTVVPLSTTPPDHAVQYQCELTFEQPLPEPFGAATMWAKADMLATLCLDRMDFFRTDRDQYGKRKYLHPKVSTEQLRLIHSAILHALGLRALTEHL